MNKLRIERSKENTFMITKLMQNVEETADFMLGEPSNQKQGF